MNANTLEVGATYYRITYADVAQTMPGVEPLIYVGIDIFGPNPDGAARYYFQDTVSVSLFGLRGGSPPMAEATAEASTAEDDQTSYFSGCEAIEIGEVIVDLPTVVDKVGSALDRAKALGFPKLEKAKGRWV